MYFFAHSFTGFSQLESVGFSEWKLATSASTMLSFGVNSVGSFLETLSIWTFKKVWSTSVGVLNVVKSSATTSDSGVFSEGSSPLHLETFFQVIPCGLGNSSRSWFLVASVMTAFQIGAAVVRPSALKFNGEESLLPTQTPVTTFVV